ncbi:MAG: threonine/serine exporter family protein [Ruminococcus sp.]|nr:threonine/serine exporter family protein [Ruminococcus sp.]
MRTENYELLHTLLDFGEAMLRSGAEIYRVENTMTHLARAYGATEISIFVITSSIVATIKLPNGYETTQSRRILNASGTNLETLEKLNALSRKCCKAPIPLHELRKEIAAANSRIGLPQFLIGSVLAAASMCIFFGGTGWDAVAASVFALLICLMQKKLSPLCPNNIVFNLLCSFLAGVAICATARMIPVLHTDKIIIGDIMLLIPGFVMTNSLRDMLVGDTISGIMRFTESLLWAIGLASGFMLAIWMIGG